MPLPAPPYLYTNVAALGGGFFLNGRADVAAAYSFRRLLSTYTGPVLRARRASDNAELDFNPSGPILDFATVSAWAGGDAFATTFYDQSGSSRNLAQSSASAQPKIINASNSRPALLFDGVNDQMVTAAFALAQPWSFNIVYRTVSYTQTGAANVFDAITGDRGTLFARIDTVAGGPYQNALWAGSAGPVSDNGTSMPVGTPGAVGGVFNAASSRIEVNAATIASFTSGNVGAGAMDGLRLGNSTALADRFANIEAQEWVAFSTAHSQAVLQADNAAMRAAWGF